MELSLPKQRSKDEWQIYIWNLPDDFLSRPQKLQLMMMLEAGFNNFDPFVVVADLLKHRDLWHGVVMDRGFIFPDPKEMMWSRMRTDLIKLRDIEQGYWNVDTLFILTGKTDDARWNEVVENWAADEVSFVEGPDVSGVLGSSDAEAWYKILTVWWD
jgi:hypothetical protein